ncbi:MAG: oligosaccharide flippase family protein, partial [Oscillospiraceae bacterium]|nr:oligosaccharide flippase family protein [Oscillospiraceae bacterium]
MVNDLTEGSVSRGLLSFAWPFMLSNLLQTLYNMVDMVIVGQYVGSVGLSAVSNAGHIQWMAMTIIMGLAGA